MLFYFCATRWFIDFNLLHKIFITLLRIHKQNSKMNKKTQIKTLHIAHILVMYWLNYKYNKQMSLSQHMFYKRINNTITSTQKLIIRMLSIKLNHHVFIECTYCIVGPSHVIYTLTCADQLKSPYNQEKINNFRTHGPSTFADWRGFSSNASVDDILHQHLHRIQLFDRFCAGEMHIRHHMRIEMQYSQLSLGHWNLLCKCRTHCVFFRSDVRSVSAAAIRKTIADID